MMTIIIMIVIIIVIIISIINIVVTPAAALCDDASHRAETSPFLPTRIRLLAPKLTLLLRTAMVTTYEHWRCMCTDDA